MTDRHKIILVDPIRRDRAINIIRNLPVDDTYEVVIQPKTKTRKLSQNALMWSGPLKDLAEQGYSEGKKYSEKTWHEYCKQEFLPEEFDPLLTLPGYVKWDYTPKGDRVLIGSTTELTTRGMGEYLEQVYALGASLGVEFHANPNERF